jgi:hypothetical protein
MDMSPSDGMYQREGCPDSAGGTITFPYAINGGCGIADTCLDGHCKGAAASRLAAVAFGRIEGRMTMRIRTAVLALVGAGLILAAAPALGGRGNSNISLVMLSSSAEATSSAPYIGDQVTFQISTAATDQPWVNISCYRDGAWVYGQGHGFFAGYQFGQVFTLGPTQAWQAGAAECTASLVMWHNGRDKTLASTSFHVEG